MDQAMENRIFDKLSEIKDDQNDKHTAVIGRLSAIDARLTAQNGSIGDNSADIKDNEKDIVRLKIITARIRTVGIVVGSIAGIAIAIFEIFIK